MPNQTSVHLPEILKLFADAAAPQIYAMHLSCHAMKVSKR